MCFLLIMFRDRGSSNARLNKSDHDYQFIFSSIIEKILEDSLKLKFFFKVISRKNVLLIEYVKS